MMTIKKGYHAFTLIELLIVIAIIAIVATVVFIALNPLQRFQETRNSQRWQDVTSVAGAIRLYQIDNNGQLPTGLDGSLRMLGTDTSGCNMVCGATGTDSFVDDSQAEFDSGIYVNTQWDNSNTWLELATGFSNGTYTSNIKDADSASTSWTSLAWNPQKPTYKELPNNGAAESSYGQGNINMNGNVLLMHFNESSGTIYDFSGRNNNGTSYYGVIYGITGKLGSALSLDASTWGYIAIPDKPELRAQRPMSVVGWVKRADTTNLFMIFNKRSANNRGWSFSIIGSGAVSFTFNNVKQVYSTGRLLDTNWHHIATTVDGSGNTAMYIDGSLSGTNNISNFLTETGTLYMGVTLNVYGQIAGYTSGSLDDMAVFNRVLSATEISDMYSRGASRLTYQVRSCDDPICSGESFVGPDGTAGSYYSELANSGVGLPNLTLTNINNNRYFQYRANLVTDHVSYSPEVNSITVNNSSGGDSSTQSSCLDLTSILTKQLPVIPRDPSQGTAAKTYYAVKRQSSGQIQVKSCGAERGEDIDVSR